MKKLYVVLGFVCFLLFFRFNSVEVSVDAHVYGTPSNGSFDDDNFYACIIDTYNKDNRISLGYDVSLTDEQLGSIKSLDCNRKEISSVKGIEKMVSLQELYLHYNQINSIDLSFNTMLEKLNLSANQLSSIDLSHNTALVDLKLNTNQLTSVNLSNNISLVDLGVSDNQLTGIDLSHNTLLKKLSLSDNILSSIDLSSNTVLEELSLYRNQISSINLPYNGVLKAIYLSRNKLSSIDLSHNNLLEIVDLESNQLNSIDLFQNTNLKKVSLRGNSFSSINFSNNTQLVEWHVDFKTGNTIYVGDTIDFNDMPEYVIFSPKRHFSYSGNNIANMTEINSNGIGTFNNAYNYNTLSLFYSDENGDEYTVHYDLSVIGARSDKYYIDEENGFIYTGSDTDSNVILSNIEVYPSGLGSIVNGEYVVSRDGNVIKRFDLVNISSDDYDLSKDYLIGDIDDIISSINYDDALDVTLNSSTNKIEVKYGNTVLSSYDYVSFSNDKYDLSKKYLMGDIDDIRDSFNLINCEFSFDLLFDRIEIKHGKDVIAYYSYVNYTSDKYDLNSDIILVGADESIDSFLHYFNCINCMAYVYDGNNNLLSGEFGDNYKLRFIYGGSEILKSYDLGYHASGVSLSTHDVQLNMSSKREYSLEKNVKPSNAYNKNVIWESSDSSVVSVDNGVITAQGYGEADITVRTVDGGFTDTCHVVVSDITTHTVSFRYEGNSYDVDFSSGENVVFKTDLDRPGYRLVGWRYNNTDYSLSDTLIMPEHDIELEAIWDVIIPDIDSYTISDGFMSGISLNTDISDFNLGIDSMYEVKITNNKEHLKNSGLIATGDNVSIYLDDELVASYKVVVKGDINGDGKNNAHDISRLYKHIRGRISMDECYIRASDVNGDTKANAHDISKMYKYIRGRISKL